LINGVSINKVINSSIKSYKNHNKIVNRL
jgi:hypothetical protein